MYAVVPFERERAALTRVLDSEILQNAPNLAQILRYTCEKSFQGEADQLKAYTIGVEALGRVETFDPKTDSIVRVEFHKLRKRLDEYYSGEGSQDPVRIVFPLGSYVPEFQVRATEDTLVPAAERPFGFRRASMVLTGCLLTALSIALWFERGGSAAPVIEARPEMPPVVSNAQVDGVRMWTNKSRSGVDSLGQTWSPERFVAGGQVFCIPPRPLMRTVFPDLFGCRREGDFDYRIPLKAGLYELRLYFAETTHGDPYTLSGGETSRLFDVLVNGSHVLRGFDVVSDAGGSFTADMKVFPGVSPGADGYLNVAFRSSPMDKAMLSGIEVVPATDERMLPLRMVAGSKTVIDRQNQAWLPDQYFQGGRSLHRAFSVSGTDEAELYAGERFGNFSYSIPVARDRRYRATLHFAEQFFGKDRPGRGGDGSRVFDIGCNGRLLAGEVDIHKQAGALRAYKLTFRGLKPNAQDKLIFQFVPIRNYPLVNAIEVVQEEN